MIVFFLAVTAGVCYMALFLYVCHLALQAELIFNDKKKMWTFIAIAIVMCALPFSFLLG